MYYLKQQVYQIRLMNRWIGHKKNHPKLIEWLVIYKWLRSVFKI